MLTDTIIAALKVHSKIVVPQLGAFLVKGNKGEVIFSSLLREDDGVLRSILTKECGNELEAAGRIDRFVFEVRHALCQEHKNYSIGELGDLHIGQSGNITLKQSGQIVEIIKESPATPTPEPPANEQSVQMEEPPIFTAQDERAAKPQRVKIDIFLVVAIAAILIAIGVIIFGYMVDNNLNIDDIISKIWSTKDMIIPAEE
ncbi:MAG: hypothetical protein SNH88_04200 [Rikenellaceae bacterium]